MKSEELKYRDQIDEIDDKLIELLVERAGCVKRVGERKNLPIFRSFDQNERLQLLRECAKK